MPMSSLRRLRRQEILTPLRISPCLLQDLACEPDKLHPPHKIDVHINCENTRGSFIASALKEWATPPKQTSKRHRVILEHVMTFHPINALLLFGYYVISRWGFFSHVYYFLLESLTLTNMRKFFSPLIEVNDLKRVRDLYY